jgi:(1->4)-alpha-D-glucan 1-alpha-D-glucosylmutase
VAGPDDSVARMAALAGIAERYTDVHGQDVVASDETKRALLADFGLPTGSAAEIEASLARVEALRLGPVPALIVAEAGRPAETRLRKASWTPRSWRLLMEHGETREGRLDGQLSPGDLPAGYHRLTLDGAQGKSIEATVIAAPARCWQPEALREGARFWGTAAQVYGLRSSRNFGIGDFSDVSAAAAGAASFGAAFLGLSPVHALFAADRSKISPYSPSSRLFLEPLYIDPTAIDGFSGSEAARRLSASEQQLQRLRAAPLVDHAPVWDVKGPILETLWAEQKGREAPDFAAFRAEQGDPLLAHATFEALFEHFRAEGRMWLGEWPQPYRTWGSAEVGRFRAEKQDRVDFHAWLQWLADRQLAAAAAKARKGGMAVGLYRDLAVGADRGGSEVWSAPDRFGPTLSVGAPPDLLGPLGQNWGLPPFDPLALESQGLAAFRALVQANMRHAGAIRIDHAFQLQRLFLIPPGRRAAEGAYVAYPFEAMLAVLRLESQRAQCLVIGEDLGTAPDGFSDAIMRSGLMSYRVLQFERTREAGFKPPAEYPRDALAVVGTHDLPTFVGWWRGLDTDLRLGLGLYDEPKAAEEREERVSERRELAEALHAEGLLERPEPPAAPPLEPVVRYLARTPSALTALQYEDILEEGEQANMPGVMEGHPNWQRRLSATIEEVDAPGGRLARLAAAMAAEGRGRSQEDRR